MCTDSLECASASNDRLCVARCFMSKMAQGQLLCLTELLAQMPALGYMHQAYVALSSSWVAHA